MEAWNLPKTNSFLSGDNPIHHAPATEQFIMAWGLWRPCRCRKAAWTQRRRRFHQAPGSPSRIIEAAVEHAETVQPEKAGMTSDCMRVLVGDFGTHLKASRYIWSRALRPPPPPLKGQWSGFRWAPPPLWCGLFALWGGCGVSGPGFMVIKYKASSRQGLREDLGCRFLRVDGLCSALSFLHLGRV